MSNSITVNNCQFYGCIFPNPINNGNSLALSNVETAANGKIAYGIMPLETFTVSSIRLFITNVVGSLGANDIEVHIYSDLAGSPKESIVSSNTTAAALSIGTWAEFINFNQELTAYTPYWFVIKNVTATPASNYITVVNTNIGSNDLFSIATLSPNFSFRRSVWNGTAWGTVTVNMLIPVVVIGNGYSIGSPFQSSTINDTDRVYGTREIGVLWKTPACKLVARALVMPVSKQGTPPNVVAKIYKGLTLVATSDTVLAAGITAFNSGSLPVFRLTTPYIFSPNTDYRIVIAAATNEGDTSNYIGTQTITWENTTTYKHLRLLSGLHQKTYFDGSNWTDTANRQCGWGFMLEQQYNGVVPIGTTIIT